MTHGALLARFVRSVCLWHSLLLSYVISFKSGYSPFAFEFYWFVKSAPFTSCLYIKNIGAEEGNCTLWERQRIKGFDNGIFSNHLNMTFQFDSINYLKQTDPYVSSLNQPWLFILTLRTNRVVCLFPHQEAGWQGHLWNCHVRSRGCQFSSTWHFIHVSIRRPYIPYIMKWVSGANAPRGGTLWNVL